MEVVDQLPAVDAVILMQIVFADLCGQEEGVVVCRE